MKRLLSLIAVTAALAFGGIVHAQEKKADRGGVKVISTSMATRERPFRTWPGTVTP